MTKKQKSWEKLGFPITLFKRERKIGPGSFSSCAVVLIVAVMIQPGHHPLSPSRLAAPSPNKRYLVAVNWEQPK